MAEAVWKTALQDGQDAGTAVIYAEAKLGKLLAAIPPKKGKTKQYGSSGGTIPSLPPGVSKRTSHQAQTIAKNPEKVRAAINNAIESDKIPTPDYVYKIIKGAHVSHNSGQNEWYTPPGIHRWPDLTARMNTPRPLAGPDAIMAGEAWIG